MSLLIANGRLKKNNYQTRDKEMEYIVSIIKFVLSVRFRLKGIIKIYIAQDHVNAKHIKKGNVKLNSKPRHFLEHLQQRYNPYLLYRWGD